MGVLGSTAAEISLAVRAGTCSAEAVVQAHLDRIAAEDGRWSAFRLVNVLAAARFAPYPTVWNLAGYPAMSTPMGTRQGGLPLGLQPVGAPGTEARLLAVTAALERQPPWRRHATPRVMQSAPG